MAKNIKGQVPEGFTVSMALVDCIPVLFFSIMIGILAFRFSNVWFTLGACLIVVAGALKCLWKFIVATAGRNIYPLFLQMRILMPIGFLLLVVAIATEHARIPFAAIGAQMTSFPAVIFYLLGIGGMIAMTVFAGKLDPADAKSNWIEQGTNGVAQLCFLIGVLL